MNHELNPWRAIAPYALSTAMATASCAYGGDTHGPTARGTSGGIAAEAPPGSPDCATAPEASSYLEASDADGGARIDDIGTSLLGGQFLKRGDIVVYADTRRIQNANELTVYLNSLPIGTAVSLQIRRGAIPHYVGVQLPPPARALPRTANPPTSAAPPGAPTIIVVEPGATVVGAAPSGEPRSYAAPGIANVPGATFAPAPATPPQAAPQMPGVSQPPWFRVQLPQNIGREPIAPTK